MVDLNQYHGKIIYSLVSSAYFVDKTWGYGVPKAGMKLMYDIGRRHNMPVTFLITGKVAQECQHMLTHFYHEGGACIGLMLDFPDQMDEKGKRIKSVDTIILAMTFDELRVHIHNEIQMIKKFLPWAEIKILGGGHRNEKVVAAAEAEGIIGIWGYCIFQIGTDNITDYGCPWGQFFIDPKNYKAPSPTPSKMIGLEWTCRDISKAFHMAKSESYSTDPNDVESNGKCTDTNIDYWIDLLNEYQRNLQYNDMVFFLQHQESHEMEATEVCVGFNQFRIEYTAKMLDKFCGYVAAQSNVKSVNLNRACEIYYAKYNGITPPTYFFQNDIKILCPPWKDAVKNNTADGSKHLWLGFNEDMYDYVDKFTKLPQFHFKEPPWKEALFYFDQDCMLVFDKGVREPIWITDYRNPGGSLDEQFMWILSPSISEIIDQTEGSIRIITYKIEVEKAIPFGLFEWVNMDFRKFHVKECSSNQWKYFDYTGIFIKSNLKAGVNTIRLILERS
jgi:hypothetical protein